MKTLEIALGHEKTVCDPVAAGMCCRSAPIQHIRREKTSDRTPDRTPGARAALRIAVATTLPKIFIAAAGDAASNVGPCPDRANPQSLRARREAAMRPFVTGVVCL